ncbi:HD domain-containing protein [candidate division WOR-3 bacterium]|nr:HD domain-containing protein [candidate division WOR-3 bacterium]
MRGKGKDESNKYRKPEEIETSVEKELEVKPKHKNENSEEVTALKVNLLETLLNYMPHRVYFKDKEGRFVAVSKSEEKALGRDKEEILGKTELEILPEGIAKKHLEEEKSIAKDKKPLIEKKESIITSEGKEKWVSKSKIPVYDEDGNYVGIFGISRDFSERKEEKEKAERLNSILRSLRNINKLISEEKDIEKLIQKSCETFVEARGYECAWIVLFDRQGTIKYHAEAGLGEKLDLIIKKLNDKKESNPFDKILNSPKVHILDCNSTLCGKTNDSETCKYLGEFMVTRLQHEDSLFGIIGISSPVEFAHEEDEISLFKEVAEDISFALHSIEEEKERRDFEKALEYKARFENMVLDISTNFINLTSDKIQVGIEKALGEIGTFTGVDRSYLLRFSDDETEVEDKYVWCAKGIERKNKIPGQSILKSLCEYMKKAADFKGICIDSFKNLPDDAQCEKKWMTSAGIKSLLVTPLVSRGALIGCIGFDSVTEEKNWSDEIVYILKITGQIFANALGRKASDEKLNESFLRMRKALEGTVQALSSIIERKDPYTAGHQNRVAQLSVSIGRRLGLSEERLENLRLAGLLHDIGKIHIPAEILNKPYSLNKIEMGLIRTHPRIGYEILKSIDFPGPVPEIVLQHHERIDGSGYPNSISGSDILIEAQILGVADLIESMSSRRPYRQALSLESALEEVRDFSGTLYDSTVVEACLGLFEDGSFSFQYK